MIATLYILLIIIASSLIFFSFEGAKAAKAEDEDDEASKEKLAADIKARDERFFKRMAEDHKRMMEAFYG